MGEFDGDMDSMWAAVDATYERERAEAKAARAAEAVHAGRPGGAIEAAEASRPDVRRADRSTTYARAASRRSRQRSTPSSVVLCVRLDPDELAALKLNAAQRGIAPSTLARNLIRIGLQPRLGQGAVADAVAQVERAAAHLRTILP